MYGESLYWYCMDCRVCRCLDEHGRCGVCRSDAVIHDTVNAGPELDLIAALRGDRTCLSTS